MSNQEQWGPWTEWAQGPSPIGSGYLVIAEMGELGSNDFIGPIPSEEFDWDFSGDPIARYRIKRFDF